MTEEFYKKVSKAYKLLSDLNRAGVGQVLDTAAKHPGITQYKIGLKHRMIYPAGICHILRRHGLMEFSRQGKQTCCHLNVEKVAKIAQAIEDFNAGGHGQEEYDKWLNN